MLEDLLVHRVTVSRRSGRRDRFGQQVDVNPRQHTEGETVATYPCRLTTGTGGMVMQERAVDTFETRYTLYTMLDVDITTADAITVTDPETGLTLLSKAKISNKTVATGGEAGHHYEYDIWQQGGVT